MDKKIPRAYKHERWILEYSKFRGEGDRKEPEKIKTEKDCVGSLQSHPQVWWLDRTHRMQKALYSQLWFITLKGYKAKLTKEWGTVQGKLGSNFKSSSPVESHRTCLIPAQQAVTAHMKGRLPGKLPTQCPGFLIGAGHLGTLC